MDNFIRNPWTITKVVPPSREVVGHRITISGTEGLNEAKVTCDGCGSYPDGTYDPGPPETIGHDSYTIIYIPGKPDGPNEITYTSRGVAGSWTADDSPSP